MTSGYGRLRDRQCRDRTTPTTPTRSVLWTTDELLGYADVQTPSTNRVRTGIMPTPTMCCWVWRWRRPPARPCRRSARQRVDAAWPDRHRHSFTPEIPRPVLHAFSSERREALRIPAGTPYYEESTFWNPSWTITHGAVQTTDIYDLEATAAGLGSGRLLSPRVVPRGVHRPAGSRPGRSRAAQPADRRPTSTPTVWAW